MYVQVYQNDLGAFKTPVQVVLHVTANTPIVN